MNPHVLTVLMNILMIIGALFALYSVYFCIVAIFGFKKQKKAPTSPASTRFAVLIAARNEATVIGQLVDSLKKQNYPSSLYDIIVAPNNCTDNTRQVAQEHGALLFDPVGPISSKGEVLTQLIDSIMRESKYDAICVFDADNLVHPDFLQKMNDAAQNGIQVAQGFRDSKNPADTAVSTCYSVCYWMLNKFYNGGREALGLSALVNGSGFMVRIPLLRRIGGWHTHTMTEDYEFSAQCMLAGEQVHYVQGAIFYDEQPLTFLQSWRQRRRWSTGSIESMESYLTDLLEYGTKHHCWASFDMALTFLTPMIQLVSLVTGLASAFLILYRLLVVFNVPFLEALLGIVCIGFAAFLLCTVFAAFVVRLNRGEKTQGTGRGTVYFAIFLLSWMPITIISMFKRQKTWDAIAHTRAVNLREI